METDIKGDTRDNQADQWVYELQVHQTLQVIGRKEEQPMYETLKQTIVNECSIQASEICCFHLCFGL